MYSELACFNPACRVRYDITEVFYSCPKCGGLLEAQYAWTGIDSDALKQVWRERRMSNTPLCQSGVWRYRELFPFLDNERHVVTLREDNTPLLNGPRAAEYAGLNR